jgi:tRNA threonylcarbamoyladenosine biosynthesis protein TsaE
MTGPSAAEPAHLAALPVASPEETRDVGRRLASCLVPGDVILVEGDLGAGKTTFVQGLAAGLGVSDPVTSPTFMLMRVIECPGGRPVRTLLHADLYRLEHLKEVVDLGLLELVDDGAVAAVEWGDAGAPVLGDSVLEVRLERGARDEDRVVTMIGSGSWVGRAAAVAAAVGADVAADIAQPA